VSFTSLASLGNVVSNPLVLTPCASGRFEAGFDA
jgi:hypothetical protein